MASKINKGEILAKFFDDGEYTALFADGAVSAACGYAAGQQAYAVYQNGEAVTVKDVEKNIKVLEMAAQTGCPVVTFYNSVGAKLAEGLDVLTASAKLNAQIAKVSGVIPQVAVVLGVCGGTSALSAANADVCIMAEGAELFFTAPFTSAAKGDKVADAGTAAAAAKAGVAAIVAPTAEEAAEKAAHIVGLLPANNLTGPAIFEFEQPTAALAAGAEPAKAAAAVVDKDSAVELYAGFGKSVYTAFATVGGNAVGVVATGKTLSVYGYDSYLPEDINALQEGSVLRIHDQGDTTVTKLTVTSIDRDADNGYVTINGGIEAGGVELTLDHDVYRTVTFDDYPVYYEMGEVTLPLAGGVTLSDSSADPQASAVETDGADAVAEAVNAEPDGWMPNNTLVFTEDGTISSIVRIWVP